MLGRHCWGYLCCKSGGKVGDVLGGTDYVVIRGITTFDSRNTVYNYLPSVGDQLSGFGQYFVLDASLVQSHDQRI